MKINDKIRDEKLQYDINKEAAKTSAFLSSQMDILQANKYCHLIKV